MFHQFPSEFFPGRRREFSRIDLRSPFLSATARPMDPTFAMACSQAGGLRADAIDWKPWQLRNVDRCYAEHVFGSRRAPGALGCGVIIADDMGMGKTASAIASMALARAVTKRRTVLIAVPSTTIATAWAREIRAITTWEKVAFWSDMDADQRRSFSPGSADALIVTHCGLERLFSEHFSKVPGGSRRSVFERYEQRGPSHPIFSSTRFAGAALDESHEFRNDKTSTFAAAAFATRGVPFPVLLTGTPVQNRMEDFVSQLVVARARPEFTEGGVARHPTQILLNRLHATSLIRARDKPRLPALVKRDIVLEMPAEEGARLETLLCDCMYRMHNFLSRDGDFVSVLGGFTRIRKASIAHAYFDDVEDEETFRTCAAAIVANPSTKVLEAAARARALSAEGRKVVVFCTFVAPLVALEEMLTPALRAGVLHGRLSAEEKERAIRRFREDPDEQVLLVSTKCGGVGLNLQEASAAIVLDVWWNPFVTLQAIRRIWRMGQPRDCVVEVIKYENSFDDVVTQMYHTYKEKIAEAITEGRAVAAATALDPVGAANMLREISRRRGNKKLLMAATRLVECALEREVREEFGERPRKRARASVAAQN